MTAVAIAPDGRTVASGANDGTLAAEIGRARTDKVASLCFAGAACIVSGGRDDHVRLHAIPSGKALAASKNHVDS